ncbi:MAG: hypothetical protein ACXV2C_00635 [Candidatus Bathyarchaeia archaeon]
MYFIAFGPAKTLGRMELFEDAKGFFACALNLPLTPRDLCLIRDWWEQHHMHFGLEITNTLPQEFPRYSDVLQANPGRLCFLEGRFKDAIPLLKQDFQNTAEEKIILRARILALIALARFYIGEVDDAIDDVNEVISLYDTSRIGLEAKPQENLMVWESQSRAYNSRVLMAYGKKGRELRYIQEAQSRILLEQIHSKTDIEKVSNEQIIAYCAATNSTILQYFLVDTGSNTFHILIYVYNSKETRSVVRK